MKANEIIEYFKEQYPGKNIVSIPEDAPTEIICEVDPSSLHPEFNRAMIAIKKAQPHYHKEAVETYKVLSGELQLTVGDKVVALKKGDEYIIQPNIIHHAEGDFTLVQVDSTPGWTIDDHILVEES